MRLKHARPNNWTATGRVAFGPSVAYCILPANVACARVALTSEIPATSPVDAIGWLATVRLCSRNDSFLRIVGLTPRARLQSAIANPRRPADGRTQLCRPLAG